MTIRRNWQIPETVPIWAEIKVAGALVNPSEPVLLTVSKPDGTVLINSVTMENDSMGMYVYFYTTTGVDVAGWFKTKVVAQDGTGDNARITIEYGGFFLQKE